MNTLISFDVGVIAGGTKLAVHVLRLCQANIESHDNNQIQLPTLVGLLCLLAGKKAYNNVYLRHNVFCILQIAAGRLEKLLYMYFPIFTCSFITANPSI